MPENGFPEKGPEPDAGCSGKAAQNSTRQNVSGIVDVEIEPGKGDEKGSDPRNGTQLPAPVEKDKGGGKGGGGVAGREGKILRGGDQEVLKAVCFKGADPTDKRF